MSSNSKYHNSYTEFGEPYQLVLPLNSEGLVPDDDFIRLLSHELEGLDYRLRYQAYFAKGRNLAVDPKTIFKIMWMLAGQKDPDYNTIACFRTGFLIDVCEDPFYHMVKHLGKS